MVRNTNAAESIELILYSVLKELIVDIVARLIVNQTLATIWLAGWESQTAVDIATVSRATTLARWRNGIYF
ncbi:hypothetical protein DWU99_00015 [Dyella psychrodurans]|uniref:Uncharacterized protein n=1 Tax=Dyella psychrodurans TaxID=1927960 RepID=A0A370XBE3_9GAMM|nr:hypothetical protein DWU99_00015 [Dyella psychrodurans]